MDAGDGLTVLRIKSQMPEGSEVQTVFAADRHEAEFSSEQFSFKGRFAVFSEVNGELEYIYLGDAVAARFKGWSARFGDGRPGAADIRFKNGNPVVNALREVVIEQE